MSDWTATRPGGTCPWRRSSTIGGGDIPGFDLDLMRGVANTVGADDNWRPMMTVCADCRTHCTPAGAR